MENRIHIKDLRDFMNSMFDHVERDLGLSHVDIDDSHNHFWEVQLDDMFELLEFPPVPALGSTIDSLEFVNVSIAAGAKDSYAATLMLMHVIPLLQVICHKVRA
jgi:hypothetical protein